ncbi:TIGR03943 family protein [Oscillatoria sp. FACHB-1407]|uniref:TIGR03943 family putative permease subunit n=1 Tax=Oscillatoria sp. FACHB-1407 TaxID=2692847 RepID=UPI001683618F|nr:TIGR03943 family protein [Oscillatoria sp. FACHB-1407]MBD2461052.1 TIGR03943 family protein [Oscillatoria sp. FACHB-1407]
MATRSRRSKPFRLQDLGNVSWLLWLDITAILAWGVLLLKYWLTNKLNILLHPDYMWLAYSTGAFFLVLAGLRTWQVVQLSRSHGISGSTLQHFSLLPRRWSAGILLVVALLGLVFTPEPFASETALARGVTDTLTMTRSRPQAFRGGTQPGERSLIEWVRTLNVYPEPDAYKGQDVNVEGFVIASPDLPSGYFTIARFVITCCAADVYPVGLPVKLGEGQTSYPSDTWLRVQGKMTTETLNNQRQLVIAATQLEQIEEPENPYDY